MPDHGNSLMLAASLLSEDGSIMLHDGRAGSGLSQAQATLQQTTEFTGVQYHPRMEHIFATSDNRGKVYLRDVRMAFGPLRARTKQGIVQTVSAPSRTTCSASVF